MQEPDNHCDFAGLRVPAVRPDGGHRGNLRGIANRGCGIADSGSSGVRVIHDLLLLLPAVYAPRGSIHDRNAGFDVLRHTVCGSAFAWTVFQPALHRSDVLRCICLLHDCVCAGEHRHPRQIQPPQGAPGDFYLRFGSAFEESVNVRCHADSCHRGCGCVLCAPHQHGLCV